jgi:hypothetical protein
MFATGHETEYLLAVRKPTYEDRLWAENFLKDFRLGHNKPALKVAVNNFFDIFKIMPRHAKLFYNLVSASFVDKGNNYSRYTISKIIYMYIRRRVNLILFKAFPPYKALGNLPFGLYALHTQPESSIDVAGSYFSNQIELITFIARSLPVTHELYVKIHPTDVDGKTLLFYKRISKIPSVRLINYDIDSKDLVQRAAIIFTLTGTIGYEAALLGKWVITFSNNYYNKMPTVNYCESPIKLPTLINLLLKKNPNKDIEENILIFLTNLKAKSFHGEINRMFLPNEDKLTQQDLNTLQNVFKVLHAKLVPNSLSTENDLKE